VLAKRLLRLEARFGSKAAATRCSGLPSGADVITQNLASLGIVREPNESLAETTARAMGITMADLRNQLLTVAGGG